MKLPGPTRRRNGVTGLLSFFVCTARVTGEIGGGGNQSPGETDFAALSLEELGAIRIPVVSGASKREQKITEAPSAVSIVTRQDIQEYGYRTLADIINGVRGFYTIFDRGYYFAGTRGLNRLGDYGGRLLININGHRMNEPIYDSAWLGNDFLLDVDLIDRVEVIRGPSQSIYGNNAFVSVINVVTRPAGDFGPHGFEISGLTGTFETYQGRVSYGKSLTNGVQLVLSGTYYESAGNPRLRWTNPEFVDNNNGVVANHDGESAKHVFASLAYHNLTLEGGYSRRDKEMPNAPYGSVFNDKRAEVYDERAYAELRYQHPFANGWEVTARLYGDYYDYAGYYPYNYGDELTPDVVVNYDAATAVFYGGELRASARLFEKHDLLIGIEGRSDPILNQVNKDVNPPALYLDRTDSRGSFGIYLQDDFHLLRQLILSAGIRYDSFTTFGDTLNPRAGIIYNPIDGTTLKALYGEAYRAPNAYESLYGNSIAYRFNPHLKPESVRSYEFVWEQSLAKNYRLTGTLFLNQIDRLITQFVAPDDDQFAFENTDSVEMCGAETEVEARWDQGFRARASYTYAEAIDKASGHMLPNAPKHLGKLQLTVPLYPEKLISGFELLVTDARISAQGRSIPGRVVANLNFYSREVVRNVELSVGIHNLFDARYSDPTSPDFVQDAIPQDGRTLRVKLNYKF